MARDPYEVVLADLRAKRDEIDKLIHSLEAFRPGFVASAPNPIPASSQPSLAERGEFFGKTIVEASKTVLERAGRPLANAEIVAALKEGGLVMNSPDPVNTVSSVLNRALQQKNGVERVGRGVWKRVLSAEEEIDEEFVDMSDEEIDDLLALNSHEQNDVGPKPVDPLKDLG